MDMANIGMRKGVLDIHDYTFRLERELATLGKSKISPANKKVIRRFFDDCVVQGLSKARIVKLIEVTRQHAALMRVDLEKADIDDVKHLLSQIESKPWTPWTKATHRIILKKFYKWLRGTGKKFPLEVDWIHTAPKAKDIRMLSEKELITQEEIQRAIDLSVHPRTKAFISVLAESGCRVGEIGSLTIKNVAFDAHGTILTVSGKTGYRRIRVVQSTKYLRNWLECHPFQDEPESAVWVNIGNQNRRQPTMYPALAKLLRDAFKAAGVKKRCNPHVFRHSRASILANHLTEFQMNHYFGWTQGSSMPSTYVHLTGKDLDAAILEAARPTQVEPQVVIADKRPEEMSADRILKALFDNPSTRAVLVGKILELHTSGR